MFLLCFKLFRCHHSTHHLVQVRSFLLFLIHSCGHLSLLYPPLLFVLILLNLDTTGESFDDLSELVWRWCMRTRQIGMLLIPCQCFLTWLHWELSKLVQRVSCLLYIRVNPSNFFLYFLLHPYILLLVQATLFYMHGIIVHIWLQLDDRCWHVLNSFLYCLRELSIVCLVCLVHLLILKQGHL